MKTFPLLQTVAVLAGALVSVQATGEAGPIEKRDHIPASDIQILQFALTLEHLENTFYHEGLAKFSLRDFHKAGYPTWVRETLEQISTHEQSHVDFLTKTIAGAGEKPTRYCTYKFPLDTIESFIATSQVFEGVGVSAYLGALKAFKDKNLLPYAGSIAEIESRQEAVMSEITGTSGLPGSFDTAITPSLAFTLAHPSIVSCPKSNPQLPAIVFPALSVVTKSPKPGHIITVKSAGKQCDKKLYLAFLAGLETHYVPVHKVGKGVYDAVIPAEIEHGRIYLALTDAHSFADDHVIAAGVFITNPKPGMPPVRLIKAKRH